MYGHTVRDGTNWMRGTVSYANARFVEGSGNIAIGE